ncbi:MAG: hypothetical protein BWY59_01238 [Verrucomicrobia bacterium ADurb.Bin345]|nr:MAG: hypothetical protein BWY59_01238 [Verrucomicrobia bacterium ADurb.Bin345]
MIAGRNNIRVRREQDRGFPGSARTVDDKITRIIRGKLESKRHKNPGEILFHIIEHGAFLATHAAKRNQIFLQANSFQGHLSVTDYFRGPFIRKNARHIHFDRRPAQGFGEKPAAVLADVLRGQARRDRGIPPLADLAVQRGDHPVRFFLRECVFRRRVYQTLADLADIRGQIFGLDLVPVFFEYRALHRFRIPGERGVRKDLAAKRMHLRAEQRGFLPREIGLVRESVNPAVVIEKRQIMDVMADLVDLCRGGALFHHEREAQILLRAAERFTCARIGIADEETRFVPDILLIQQDQTVLRIGIRVLQHLLRQAVYGYQLIAAVIIKQFEERPDRGLAHRTAETTALAQILEKMTVLGLRFLMQVQTDLIKCVFSPFRAKAAD